MGCCASMGRVGDEAGPLDPKRVDMRHFDVQRTLGEVSAPRRSGGDMHKPGLWCGPRIDDHQPPYPTPPSQGGFGKVNAVVKKSAPEAGTWYAMKMLGKRVILEKRMLEEILRELTLLKEARAGLIDRLID